MKNGAVIVCVDFVDRRHEENALEIVGFKFLRLENAHTQPFVSSRFNIHLASKISSRLSDYNVNCLAAKMYAMPHRVSSDIKTKSRHQTYYKVIPCRNGMFLL